MEDVKQTFNYDQFKLCSWNRAIKQTNLNKIDRSVQVDGWLVHPITVNEKMEVIDGQHRLVYAKTHNLPVYYIVVPNLGIEDCVVMNNSRMAWNLLDYVRFYANQDNENYLKFKEIIEKYTFATPNTLANIIKNSGTSGNPSVAIKNGTFTISPSEYAKAIEKLDYLEECAKYVLRIPGRASSILAALSFAYDCPGVNPNLLMKRVKNDIGIVTPPANFEMALKEVEKLYNFRRPNSGYIYIYTEYKKQATKNMSHKKEA